MNTERGEQMTFDCALALRDDAMDHVERNAGDDFKERATAFIINYLESHGATPSEDLTDQTKLAGIKPHDDRAFGPVYLRLYRQGRIVPVGDVARRKGHGTHGGRIWSLVSRVTGQQQEAA